MQRETSEELEKKQRIVERLEALEAELNNKNSLLSRHLLKSLQQSLKNLQQLSLKSQQRPSLRLKSRKRSAMIRHWRSLSKIQE